jgi:predicted Na+-dependent transporter
MLLLSCCLPAQGNVGLAIFLTVVTNILGIALVPLWLKAMLNTPGSPLLNSSSSTAAGQLHSSISINVAEMFVKLLLSNLAPTLLGKLLRDCCPAVRSWVLRSRTSLAITLQCLPVADLLALAEQCTGADCANRVWSNAACAGG